MERREIFQFKQTISIPREKFIKNVVCNGGLSHTDLQVCLLLLTQLDGWDMTRREDTSSVVDPYNYKAIDMKGIAKMLHIKKKEVKESIDVLIYEGILEFGENMTKTPGYRFLF